MLNEQKVKLMTKIAIFEKNEAEDIHIASTNFKVDYVTLNMLYTAVETTLGFLIVVAIYVLAHMETLFSDLGAVDFPALFAILFRYYMWTLGGFLAVAFVYYMYRYSVAFKKVKKDYMDLKSLAKMKN